MIEKMNERTYYGWRCENPHPSMRPNGLKITAGCMSWQIKSSKYSDLGDKELQFIGGVQGLCKNCGRKPRLQPNTTNLRAFKSRLAAKEYCEAMNSTGVGF